MRNKKTAKKGPITGAMTVQEVTMNYPEAAAVFAKHGLHCIGCQLAAYENVAAGARAHGIDLEKLLADMNEAVAKNQDKGTKDEK